MKKEKTFRVYVEQVNQTFVVVEAKDADRATGQAVQMLADWCDAIRDNGTGWDDWDEHYKDADFRPCMIRELIDAAKSPAAE